MSNQPQWNDDRLARAYAAVQAVMDDRSPEPETDLHGALDYALSNIEHADEILSKREEAA